MYAFTFAVFGMLSFVSANYPKDWRNLKVDVKSCLEDCVQPDKCFSVEEMHMYNMAGPEQCHTCTRGKCPDPTLPFDFECLHQSRIECDDFCEETYNLRAVECSNCRAKCFPVEAIIKIHKTRACLRRCKKEYSCADEPSRECNKCIFDRCNERTGPGCSIWAQCSCRSCPPVKSYRNAVKCRRCYMNCGAGVAGGPVTFPE